MVRWVRDVCTVEFMYAAQVLIGLMRVVSLSRPFVHLPEHSRSSQNFLDNGQIKACYRLSR